MVSASTLAATYFTASYRSAGYGASIGGLEGTTDKLEFAARPSGTEDAIKIYCESFPGKNIIASRLRKKPLGEVLKTPDGRYGRRALRPLLY